jgi:hypothetical protein
MIIDIYNPENWSSLEELKAELDKKTEGNELFIYILRKMIQEAPDMLILMCIENNDRLKVLLEKEKK